MIYRLVNAYQVYNKFAPIQREKMYNIINNKNYRENYVYKGKINKDLKKHFNNCIKSLDKKAMYSNILDLYYFVMNEIQIDNYEEYIIKINEREC